MALAKSRFLSSYYTHVCMYTSIKHNTIELFFFIVIFQLKKLKFDLQKAVNIPVNAISAVSGAHLRDKLQRLLVLLSGQQVEITNKRFSVNEHPAALTFCKHLIAKMVVVSYVSLKIVLLFSHNLTLTVSIPKLYSLKELK